MGIVSSQNNANYIPNAMSHYAWRLIKNFKLCQSLHSNNSSQSMIHKAVLIKQLTKNEITYRVVCTASSNSNNINIIMIDNSITTMSCTGKKDLRLDYKFCRGTI